jgi:kynureninase
MWDIFEAEDYIRFNTLDNEDFIEADDDRKTALLNVSKRTLERKFKEKVIPNEAVYIFAATLGSAFNDTNKLQQQGIAGFSIKGISFTFKDWAKRPVDHLIPDEVYDLVGAPRGRTVKWTVL